MGTTTTLRCAGESHPGRVRKNNEDRFHLDLERGIFIVIDGVGGQAAGEEAADIALTRIRARLERRTGRVIDRIREAITVANNEIYRLAQTNAQWRGMACVLTVAVIEDGQATIGHVGDTRLYQIGQGQIRKITHDHSPVGEREDKGQLTELEAMRHPRRNEVYRDVGSEEHSPDDEDFIETVQIPFEPKCALLLCSDGLSDLVTSTQMLRIVEQYAGDPWAVVQQLIEAANHAGGKDNITVLLIEGEQFAAAAPNRQVPSKGSGSDLPPDPVTTGRFLKPLASRWAVLIYGILLGIILSSSLLQFWRNPALSGTEQQEMQQAKTYVVGPGMESDFATINQALEKAEPGDTIEVTPGQYFEQIHLKDGVSLISRKPREAVIQLTAQLADPEIAVLANNIESGRFVGFKILGDEKNPLGVGLRLVDADVEIEEVEISGGRLAGIEIGGATEAALRANYIHDNPGIGIVVRAQAVPRLAHNLIINNGKQAGKRRAGIEIHDAARPILVGNLIANNGLEGIRGGNVVNEEVLQKNFFRIDRESRTRPPKRSENAAEKALKGVRNGRPD